MTGTRRRPRVQVEQAIARGLTPSQIMRLLDLTYAEYAEVRNEFERAVFDLPERPPAPRREDESHWINGRHISSYYSPAPPEVIERLVNDVCPTERRRSVFVHGTVAGYKRHRRAAEQACVECLAAKREYAREQSQRRRQQRRKAA